MVVLEQQNHLFGQERLKDETSVGGGRRRDPQINLVRREVLMRTDGAQNLNGEANAGIASAKGAQDVDKVEARHKLDHSHAEIAALARGSVREVLLHVLNQVEHMHDVSEEGLACRRQLHFFALPIEQFNVEFCFQLLHLHGNGGLRILKLFGGLHKTSLFCDGFKCL